jgi:hypothetical protein
MTSHLTNIIKAKTMGKKINIKPPTGYQSLITNGRHGIVGDEPKLAQELI